MCCAISTSKYGLGSEPGSNRTPLGLFRIAEKHGDGAAPGTIFKARVPVGHWSPDAPASAEDLITTRILVQFMGQIGAVTLLRKRKPDMNRPYLMWLYPLPSLLALAGWIFLFATSDPLVIYFGLGTLVLGVLGFVVWSWRVRQWPFSGAAA